MRSGCSARLQGRCPASPRRRAVFPGQGGRRRPGAVDLVEVGFWSGVYVLRSTHEGFGPCSQLVLKRRRRRSTTRRFGQQRGLQGGRTRTRLSTPAVAVYSEPNPFRPPRRPGPAAPSGHRNSDESKRGWRRTASGFSDEPPSPVGSVGPAASSSACTTPRSMGFAQRREDVCARPVPSSGDNKHGTAFDQAQNGQAGPGAWSNGNMTCRCVPPRAAHLLGFGKRRLAGNTQVQRHHIPSGSAR